MNSATEVIVATGKFLSDLYQEEYIAENVVASEFVPEVMDRLIELVKVVGDFELAKQRLEQELKEELDEKEDDEDDAKEPAHHDPPKFPKPLRAPDFEEYTNYSKFPKPPEAPLNEVIIEGAKPKPPEPETIKDVVPRKKTFGPKKRKGWFSW